VFERRKLVDQSSLTEAFGEPPVTLYRERDFYIEACSGTPGVNAVPVAEL
jgi:hypothetical protein